MEITKKITNLLKQSLKALDVDMDGLDVVVETPSDMSNGDYATNIAMRLSSQLKENPMDIAKRIVEKIPEDIDIESVQVATPGFINFSLSNRYYLAEIAKIVGNEEYFKLDQRENEKVLIEYTDANPFKEFHIGHLYSNTVGESFSRLQEALRADVTRACYQGDVGLHVAKSLWGLEKKLSEEDIKFEELEKLSQNLNSAISKFKLSSE